MPCNNSTDIQLRCVLSKINVWLRCFFKNRSWWSRSWLIFLNQTLFLYSTCLHHLTTLAFRKFRFLLIVITWWWFLLPYIFLLFLTTFLVMLFLDISHPCTFHLRKFRYSIGFFRVKKHRIPRVKMKIEFHHQLKLEIYLWIQARS